VSAYNCIIMKNFFLSIPESLEESARIDGANDIRIFFSIIVPLSKATIATIALFMAVAYWNDYFSTVLYIRSRDKWALPGGAAQHADEYAAGDGAGRRQRHQYLEHELRDHQGRYDRDFDGADPCRLSVRPEVFRDGRHDRRRQGLIPARGHFLRCDCPGAGDRLGIHTIKL